MMSPLSVAQFCSPEIVDLMLLYLMKQAKFDPKMLSVRCYEQSKLSFYDTRQLPPTRFFDNVVEDIEEKDEDNNVSTSIVSTSIIVPKAFYISAG